MQMTAEGFLLEWPQELWGEGRGPEDVDVLKLALILSRRLCRGDLQIVRG